MNLFRFYLLAISMLCFGDVTYSYKEFSETGQQIITWKQTNRSDGTILLEGIKKEGLATAIFSSEFELLEYFFDGGKHRYEFKKEGTKIQTSTSIAGKEKEKKHTLSDEPWIQQFWFGFKPLLRSKNTSQKFVLINPDNLDKVKMIATKDKIEEIQLTQGKRLAQRVKVTLQGFKSIFWSAHVWFDAKTHEFLKYEANEGPNTPTVTVTLENVY